VDNDQDFMSTQQLSRAFGSTRAVLAKVGPGQLDDPTPCASWDVRALINHFIGAARWGASAVMGTGYEVNDEDYSAGNFLASYDVSIKLALAAFETIGVLEKKIELAFGEFSGADLMGLVARDQFTHGWDLARAIGHHTDLDPEIAGELLIRARAEIVDAYRGPDGEAIFGPIVEAPAGACPADHLAAFLGRSV
jgi:uncharacterized protein (TIGR03086 family)